MDAMVAKAKEFGYDGVELHADSAVSEPEKIRQLFHDANLRIPCLATSIAFTHSRADRELAMQVKRSIDLASQLDAPHVRVRDVQVRTGQNMALVGTALADWLLPLGDYAADRGRTIVIENALSFRRARDLWAVLEQLNCPSIAVAWDVCSAAISGELPAVSVPTLSSRIQYAIVKDAKLSASSATLCPLGEGDVPIQKFLTRLLGIGYNGWIAFDWTKPTENLQEILPCALQRMKQWTTPVEIKKPAAAVKPAAPKPEAKVPAATA
jgi:sugar phosphate isomerase/epimerase